MRLRPVLLAAAAFLASPTLAAVEKPAALVADGIPAVPDDLAERTRPYMEFRTAGLQGWNPARRSIAVTTRFGNTAQVHEVSRPLGMRRQITFEADAISGASYSRGKGDVLVIQKDVGGSEFWQLYVMEGGRLRMITDGKSRNSINNWSHDGRWLAYTSTRRNGSDNDIYIVDPRNPAGNRLLVQVKGGGWGLSDFAPDGRSA
ncbi:MAG TPA: S9 family peptidase, partial [Allosphingosinicella sp.]|nr:S9 family peptidase [Allosphingosinicella sp.]